MKKSVRGYISIFLALIILPTYSIAILGVDFAKLIIAKSHLKQSNQLVMDSILSNYDRNLFEKYHIFGISKDIKFLENEAYDIMQNNLSTNDENYYKPEIKELKLEEVENSSLASYKNLKKQILQYMKYKMPFEIGKGILDLVNVTMSQKKFEGVINSKYDYEESYSTLNVKIEELGKIFDFYDENFQKINDIYLNLNKEFRDFVNSIKKKENKNEKLRKEIKKLEENKDGVKDKIFSINSEIKTNEKEIENAIKEYNSTNIKKYQETIVFNNKFQKIYNLLYEISQSVDSVDYNLKKFGNNINALEKSDIKDNLSIEYKNYKSKITKENIEKIQNKLLEYKDILPKTVIEFKNSENYETTKNEIINLFNPKFEIKEFNKLPSLNNYKLYTLSINSLEKKNIRRKENKKAKQNRQKLREFGKRINQIKSDSKNNIYDFVNEDILKKLESINLNDENNDFYFSDTISGYKDIISKVGSLIPDNFEKDSTFYEKIMIAEYIVEYFKNKLVKIDGEFNSQIEYILYGHSNFNSNINRINMNILGIRFMLNSIYAFTNAKINKEATSIAVAISGWTGFGVPLVRTLVISTMSFGESLIDLNKLNNSKKLEAFKNNSTWQVSISSISKILISSIESLSHDAIDNIFNSMENYSLDKLEEFNKTVEDFIQQTIDGISQSVISTVIAPVQNKIYQFIDTEKKDLDLELKSLLVDIETSISREDKNNLKKIKEKIFSFLKPEFQMIENKFEEFDSDIGNFESYFENLINQSEKSIKEFVSEKSEIFKSKIKEYSNLGKEELKKHSSSLIKSYLSDYGMSDSGQISNFGSFSGLSFDYNDYLKLLIILKLYTSDESEIFKRMAVVMDYELKLIDDNFDITKSIISLKIFSEFELNTTIIYKYYKDRKIEEIFIGGY